MKRFPFGHQGFRLVPALPATGLCLCLGLCLALLAVTSPATAKDEEKLPVPRFVSIGTDKANVRTGPGERYPIDFVFVKKDTPVKVVAEYGRWRKVEDADGSEGWVYGALLSGRRFGVVLGGQRTVYLQPDASAAPVFFADAGVIGKLESCIKDWCKIEVNSLKGWIPKTQIWGALPGEEFE